MKNCTVYKTVDFISKRWSLLILFEIYRSKGILRYSNLKRRIDGITPKILSTRLKELQSLGLIKRKVDIKSIPIKIEYKLTKKGKEFIPIIKKMKKWALKWNINNKVCERSDCLECVL